MMCMHQTPVNDKKYVDAADYYAFHIEFYPPLRARDKIKWYAGSEMGAGAAANPLDVDECAEVLRSKLKEADMTKTYFAPGRVNLIGEHLDYNGGLVMPAALTIGIKATFQKRDDSKLILRSATHNFLKEIKIDEPS